MGFPLFSDYSSPLLSLEVADGNFEGRPRVLTVLSALLDRIVRASELRHKQTLLSEREQQREEQNLTIFHGLRAPGISVDKYLDRIHKYANCSPSCFVVAYVYLDRVSAAHPNDLNVSALNVHRLVITAVMTAAKFLDDSYFNNAYYAKVGGVTTEEMNRLELEFLFRIGFRLNVTVEEFNAYCTLLEAELWKLSSRGPNIATPFSCGPIAPSAAPLSVLAAESAATQVVEAQSHSRPITPPTPTAGDSDDGSAMDLTMSQHRQPHPSTVAVANQQKQHTDLQCRSHLQQAPEQCRGHGASSSTQQVVQHLLHSNNHSHEQQQQQPHHLQHLLHEQQQQQHQLLQGQLRQYLELQQLQQQQHDHLQQQMQQQLRMQQQQAQQSWWSAQTEQQHHQQQLQHQHYEQQQQQQQQQQDRHQYRHSWSFSDARAAEQSTAVQSSLAAATIPRSVTAPSLPPGFPVAAHTVAAASPALSSTSSLSSSCCDWEEAEDVEYGGDESSYLHDKSAIHRPGYCTAEQQVYSYQQHQHFTFGQQQQQLLSQQQQQQQLERAPAALTPPRNCEAPIRLPRCYSYCVAE